MEPGPRNRGSSAGDRQVAPLQGPGAAPESKRFAGPLNFRELASLT